MLDTQALRHWSSVIFVYRHLFCIK